MTIRLFTIKQNQRFYGQLFRSFRVGFGLSQARLAELSGTTQALISKFEAGSRNVSLAALLKILRVYDCRLSAASMPGTPELVSFQVHKVGTILQDTAENKWYYCFFANDSLAHYSEVDLPYVKEHSTRFFSNENHSKDVRALTWSQFEILPDNWDFKMDSELIGEAFRKRTEPLKRRG